MSYLTITNLQKNYGTINAIRKVFLEVRSGELLAVLGPSGCGKSTLLSCIAGTEIMDKGKMELGGRILSDSDKNIFVPPEKRNIGMVFQNYALWPHMNVEKNIGFPLKMSKKKRDFIEHEVRRILNLIHMEEKGARYPEQLSGGEQQRVALGRALIMNPSLLLLDEPLSNLDAKLREEMQEEIRNIQKKLKLTVIHVTHDQTEAMAMSDRIALMNKGEIIQSGKPSKMYEFPETVFAAEFLGVKNILKGKICQSGGKRIFLSSDNIKVPLLENSTYCPPDKVCCVIRPENIEIKKIDRQTDPALKGKILSRTFKGNHYLYLLEVNNTRFRVQTHCSDKYENGEYVKYRIRKSICIPRD